MHTRKMSFSGSWYPSNAKECESEINKFLKEKSEKIVKRKVERKLVGGIVPHAGWFFSGSIACNVIHCLAKEESTDVFLIFGMHLHSDSPFYITERGALDTPFGALEIEENITRKLIKQFDFHVETHDNFSQDNTIELQLPFIKYFFKGAKIVPIGVPPVKEAVEVGKFAAQIATKLGLKTKVIGSTDLTHYGPRYWFTPKGTGAKALDWVRVENDKRIIDAMLEMNPLKVLDEAAERHNACCAGAVASAIAAAKQLGAKQAECIEYSTSYDKNPDDSFVGYAGIVF